MTTPRLRVESFGRLPVEGQSPSTNDEESDRAASAETWILTGGAWKKRKEAAMAAAAAVEAGVPNDNRTSSAPSSPYRNRVVSKLQPPSIALQRPKSRGRTQSTERSSAANSDAVSTTSRSSSRSRSSRVSEPSLKQSQLEARRPSLTSRQDSFSGSNVSRNFDNFGAADSPFLRSSSALSGISSKGSTVDTRRSIRTSQTEPARPTSSNITVGGASISTSTTIPAVVKEKKRKQKKSSKPATAWLQQKDDFFSATRHSESVPRPGRSPVQSEIETASRSASVISRDDYSRSTASSWKPKDESSARPASTSTRTRNSSPAGKDEIHWMNISQKQASPKEPLSSWKDEKKEPDVPVERALQSPPPPEEIPASVRATHLRKVRARSTTPRARNAASSEGRQRHLSPLQRKARERTPERKKSAQRKLRSPSPETKVPILSAKELLGQGGDDGVIGDYSKGLPLTHVTAIRQCFGFDCDIYKDVLRVGRSATDRQLRIAYFRQGRNILAEHQQLVQNSSLEQASMLKSLSADTKDKFQAVSLAYEIINRPEWRALYDQHGWDAPLADFPVPNRASAENERHENRTPPPEETRLPRQERTRSTEPRSRSTTPILRPAVDPDERRSRSAGRGIRWSEQVEELVFRQDPAEIESRKLRSPPPPEVEPTIFDEDWMQAGLEGNSPGAFMANFLNELDQSLDGLEASLDGLMGKGFEDWSLSSKGSKTSAAIKQQDKRIVRIDRQSAQSPVSLGSEGSSHATPTDELDTLPSRLTDQGQGPTNFLERDTPSPPGWDGGASMTSTLPSSIHSLDESEDMTVKQLFTALTKTTDDRKRKEDTPSEIRKPEETDDRSSPSDVRKMPTEGDEVARAFSDYAKKYVEVQPKAQKRGDYFDPFDDSSSTININDSDFGGAVPRHGELPKKFSPPRLPIVEDVTSEASSPERSPARPNAPGSSPKTRTKPPSPKSEHLFSKSLPEFQEDGPLQSHFIEAPSFPRAHSETSSLTGNTRSTGFDNSVKTYQIMNPMSGNHFCAPIRDKVSVESRSQTAVKLSPSKEELPAPTPDPCDADFLSHLFCYTNAISKDLSSFSNEFSSKLSATQAMILESLTFSDEQMKSVASAMEMPGVERSNTI